MSSSKRASGSSSSGSTESKQTDYQRAMDRLDAAVRNLGDAAKDSLADRAALILEETTARLKAEFDGDKSHASQNLYEDDAELYEDEPEARARTRRPGHWREEWRSTQPVRDLDRNRIWGICAGIAPYLGLKIWVVRCIAITGFLFVPQVVVPAYLIGYFVLEPVGGSDKQRSRRAKRSRRRARKASKVGRGKAAPSPRAANPEPEPVVAPRTRLRTVRSTLDEAELRLRRMEQHVTSSRFELQRELNKIDA